VVQPRGLQPDRAVSAAAYRLSASRGWHTKPCLILSDLPKGGAMESKSRPARRVGLLAFTGATVRQNIGMTEDEGEEKTQ